MTTATTTPLTAPNYKVSTIGIKDIIPTAQRAAEKFVKGKSQSRILRYFNSHYTLDDLIMDAVEKVIRANPMYLTRSYVYTAVRCVCIDRMQQKKLPWAEIQSLITYEDGYTVPIEDTLLCDTFNHMEPLEQEILSFLGPRETQVYEGLLSNKLYVGIAEDMGVSVRTLERMVSDLKWKIEFLLFEEEPK